MIQFEDTVKIDCPREEVFTFLANFENEPLWKANVMEKKKITDGPIGVGTRWREKVRVVGPPAVNTFEVTEYEPSRKLSYKNASGPFSVLVHYTLDPLAQGTNFQIASELGVPRLAKPLMSAMYKKSMGTMLNSLKEHLESQNAKLS